MPGISPAGAVARLARIYPREALAPETVDEYRRLLADVPADALERAVDRHAATRAWFPKVSELLELAAEVELALPSEHEALAQVNARLAWAAAGESARGDPPAVHPLVLEAVQAVGRFAAFRVTDKPEVVRAQFRRAYSELRAAAIRAEQTGRP